MFLPCTSIERDSGRCPQRSMSKSVIIALPGGLRTTIGVHAADLNSSIRARPGCKAEPYCPYRSARPYGIGTYIREKEVQERQTPGNHLARCSSMFVLQ